MKAFHTRDLYLKFAMKFSQSCLETVDKKGGLRRVKQVTKCVSLTLLTDKKKYDDETDVKKARDK